MRIALILPSLRRTAPILVARDLSEGYISAGHEVSIFYLDATLEVEFPCPTEHLKILKFRRLNEFDVVHTHMLRPDAVGWLCKKQSRGTRFITTIHNIVEQDLLYSHGKFIAAIFSRLWRHAWSRLDGRVVLTDSALAYYTRTQPAVNFKRIYNGRSVHAVRAIDEHDLGLIQAAKRHGRLIGACAGVSRIKGLEQVIRALPSLPQYAFLLVGDGPARQELLVLAQTLGVADRVVSLGYRSNARDYLPYMDLYAMPSRSEGLPLALLEAVSAGIPAVCSDIPQFREVFSDQEVAYFSLDDIDGFADAVRRAEQDGPAQRARALARFQACYTQEVMVRNYLDYFESLMRPQPAGVQ